MSDKISSKLARNLESGPVGARDSVERLGNSLIRDVANAGMGLDDVVALWYGGPDLPTPDFICQAATASLARGETFYTPNFGIDELREALAEYMTGLYQRPIDSDRVAVTASGMSATNLMQQVLTNPGDNVVVTAPVWPNLIETVRVMGAAIDLASTDVNVRLSSSSTHENIKQKKAATPMPEAISGINIFLKKPKNE